MPHTERGSLVRWNVNTDTYPAWGLRGEIKEGGGRRCLAIFDDDQSRDRPQPPSALRVATGQADFFVAPPPL